MGETFYEAKRRHRRAGWKFSLVAAVGVVITGIPVAILVSPPLAALIIVVVDLLSLALPMPDLVGQLQDLEPVTIVCLAVLPGLAVVLAAWLTVRRLFLRAGAEALVLATGAREPRQSDPEEQQLVNLIEEMALAAGIPPLKVRVLDSRTPNAAIVGRSIDDATVVIPRGLLDQIGRRATSAVVADLVGSAVNGDLPLALSITTATGTLDFLAAVLAAPNSVRARKLLPHILRVKDRDAQAHFITDELVALALSEDVTPHTTRATWRESVGLPFLLARLAMMMLRMFLHGLLVSPAAAMLWRRRRMLADATAGELTRDPDALIEALEHLWAHGASVPAGPWSHLFVVGPELERDRALRQHEQSGNPYKAPKEQVTGHGLLTLVPYLPSVEKRIERLVAMGGTRTTEPYRRPSLRQRTRLWPLAYAAIFCLAIPLLAVAVVALLAASLVLVGLAAALVAALFAGPVLLVHALAY